MNAVDTNVLLYVHDPRDRRKQQLAGDVVASLEDGVLLWQVACEFVSAARKLQGHGFGPTEAFAEIVELRLRGRSPSRRRECGNAPRRFSAGLTWFNLSLWDSLVVSAAVGAGVRRFYTEDFSAYREIDGLEIVNPF